jgi:hypothetical protein
MLIRQFFLAVVLSIVGLTVSAQTEQISGNLVPLPGHSTINGLTVNQAYAVNQALSAAGAGVIISGFNYGYQYNLGNSWTQCTATNQDGSCSWTMTFNPRVDVNVSIRDNNNAQIYGRTHIETGVNTGNVSRDFQYRFNDPRDILTLGNFNYSASTSNNSRIWGMYSQAVYTVNPCVSNPQSSPSCPGYKTYYNISDDSHAIVPIPFGFPFYGKLFTHSIFFDNGTVSFYTPNQEPQRWGAGATGGNISGNMGSQFYYSIMPLWTDLINYNGAHYTQQSNQHLKYTWENISQFGNPSSSNTFSLEIRPTGFIGIQYDRVDVQWATTGMVGNSALGEFSTYNSQTNWSVNETIATDCSNPLNNVNCPGYQQAFFDQQCSANPLYSPSCPGYAEAYFTQQCSINTLYNPSCPGYATAYYNYQCSANALYHTGCPGYEQAFLTQQCNLDPLYSNQCQNYQTAVNACTTNPFTYTSCPGRTAAIESCAANGLNHNYCPTYQSELNYCTVDPLSNTLCSGYQTAVTSCAVNPLHGNYCPGYSTAVTSCDANQLNHNYCPSYQTALSTCSTDPLSNTLCSGYSTAVTSCNSNQLNHSYCPSYQSAQNTCSTNPLSNVLCSGYADAFFAQQCSADGLYSNQCPNYGEAYAKKFILAVGPTVTSEPIVEVKVAEVTATLVAEVRLVEAAPAPVATASPADTTAPVKLVSEPAAASSPVAAAAATSAKVEAPAPAAPAPATMRQQIAAQRQAAAREQAAESAKNNAGAVSAQMDSAASMEQQVELQNVVLGAMGFVAGFDAYGRVVLPDAAGYKPFEIYRGQQNVDSAAARGLLGRSDRLHSEMIDSQYNK